MRGLAGSGLAGAGRDLAGGGATRLSRGGGTACRAARRRMGGWQSHRGARRFAGMKASGGQPTDRCTDDGAHRAHTRSAGRLAPGGLLKFAPSQVAPPCQRPRALLDLLCDGRLLELALVGECELPLEREYRPCVEGVLDRVKHLRRRCATHGGGEEEVWCAWKGGSTPATACDVSACLQHSLGKHKSNCTKRSRSALLA